MTYIFAILAVRACLTSAALWRCQMILANFHTAKCDTIKINFDTPVNRGTWAAVFVALAVAGAVVSPKWFLLLGV